MYDMLWLPIFQLGSCRAGMVWKTAKAGNGEKMENLMENGPHLDRGKNGQKWIFEGVSHFFSIFGTFFDHFRPFPAGGCFPFGFSFFLISGSWPFSMACRPSMIPIFEMRLKNGEVIRKNSCAWCPDSEYTTAGAVWAPRLQQRMPARNSCATDVLCNEVAI